MVKIRSHSENQNGDHELCFGPTAVVCNARNPLWDKELLWKKLAALKINRWVTAPAKMLAGLLLC